MLGELKLMPPRTAMKVNCLVMRYLHFESVRGDLQECYFALPDANFLSSWCQFQFSRAQNRGFCAFLAFGTLVFEHFEHKIDIFVLGQTGKLLRSAAWWRCCGALPGGDAAECCPVEMLQALPSGDAAERCPVEMLRSAACLTR